jgi:MFS family permease
MLGSEMTTFGLTLWIWEQTGQATPLTLMLFCSQFTKLLASIVAGIIVDGCNRKQLLLLSDWAGGVASSLVLGLLLTKSLAVEHLYLISALNGGAGYFHYLAYSTTFPQLVPKDFYARASALDALKGASTYVVAPALAGILYPFIGLKGILGLDLVTFAIAVISLQIITIPGVRLPHQMDTLHDQFTFGFRYIFHRPSLLAILLFLLSTNLLASASFALFPALILARSYNDAATLASVQSAFGLGGILGAATLGFVGVPRPHIHGVLLGAALPQMGLIVLALGQKPLVWILAAFGAACFVPLLGSSNQAIWLAKVQPTIQGKVFSARFLIAQLSSPVGYALAGPLADYIFEPALQTKADWAQRLGSWFGMGPGSGVALLIFLLGVGNLTITLAGYSVPRLRNVEMLIPDFDTTEA